MTMEVSSIEQSRLNATIRILSSRNISLSWTKTKKKLKVESYVIIFKNIKKGREVTFTMEAPCSEFSIPTVLCPGSTYSIQVKAVTPIRFENGVVGYTTVAQSSVLTFRSELTKLELTQLKTRAINTVNNVSHRCRAVLCNTVYRNKPVEYFNHIYNNRDGIMEVYTKDNHGDPGSPINGRLAGLFFATSVDLHTGLPPSSSMFGPQRLSLHPSVLFHANANLYFADFYCNNIVHYVTLVITTRGSSADALCQEKLIQLDVCSNPFFYKQQAVFTGTYPVSVYVTQNVWVEILYTENLNITDLQAKFGAYFTFVESTGTSTPGGLPKKPSCPVCNLYPK